MMKTPHYLIDKSRLLRNIERIAYLREKSGAKALLPLRCSAASSVFDVMRPTTNPASLEISKPSKEGEPSPK